MTCPECQNRGCAGKLPSNVLEVAKSCDPILFHKVIRPASLGDDTTTPPEELGYKNVLLVYEANNHAYLYSSDGMPTFISMGDISTEEIEKAIAELREEVDDLARDTNIQIVHLEEDIDSLSHSIGAVAGDTEQVRTELQQEVANREEAVKGVADSVATEADERRQADEGLQSQIDGLTSRSDVVDVVGSYADLQSYPTADLGDNDIVKVLDDETHDNAITYYRWNKAENEWTYVGKTGPYYTKAEVDAADNGIRHDIENLTELMPTVVQETGESETAVMSQKAVTEAISSAEPDIPVRAKNLPQQIIGQPYFSDNTAFTYRNNKLNLSLPIWNLDTGALRGTTIDLLPEADTTQNGLMSAADKTKLDSLLEIKSLNDSLSLSEDGELSVVGGGIKLYDRYGSNTDGALTQSFINSKLNNVDVALGNLSAASSTSVAIGYSSGASAYQCIAVGVGARTNNQHSIAVGSNAVTSREGELSIGNPSLPDSDSRKSRYISNVKDGELDQDAVTVHQLNEAVGNINTLLETLISGEGAK